MADEMKQNAIGEGFGSDLGNGSPGKTPTNCHETTLQIPGLVAASTNLEARRRGKILRNFRVNPSNMGSRFR
jgi:hypothetical protein